MSPSRLVPALVIRTFIVLGTIGILPAYAGPPFLTDDPQPVDFGHNEFYVFSIMDESSGTTSISGPAVEYNRGILPNTQFHVILPLSESSSMGTTNVGLGDIEVGVKYRFVQETAQVPMIGIFPMVEVAAGDAARGLGNGHTWYHLPVWMQKSWGPWTSYGGGGININHAPGMKNSGFAGWLVQRQFGQRWILGAELWEQGADAMDGRSYTVLNVGGYYNFTPNFQLLFTGGGSIAGEQHTVAYLGLYWTWGAKDSDSAATAADLFRTALR